MAEREAREKRVREITVPVLAKMFLFGSYVKNKALQKIKLTHPEESDCQSIKQYSFTIIVGVSHSLSKETTSWQYVIPI